MSDITTTTTNQQDSSNIASSSSASSSSSSTLVKKKKNKKKSKSKSKLPTTTTTTQLPNINMEMKLIPSSSSSTSSSTIKDDDKNGDGIEEFNEDDESQIVRSRIPEIKHQSLDDDDDDEDDIEDDDDESDRGKEDCNQREKLSGQHHHHHDSTKETKVATKSDMNDIDGDTGNNDDDDELHQEYLQKDPGDFRWFYWKKKQGSPPVLNDKLKVMLRSVRHDLAILKQLMSKHLLDPSQLKSIEHDLVKHHPFNRKHLLEKEKDIITTPRPPIDLQMIQRVTHSKFPLLTGFHSSYMDMNLGTMGDKSDIEIVFHLMIAECLNEVMMTLMEEGKMKVETSLLRVSLLCSATILIDIGCYKQAEQKLDQLLKFFPNSRFAHVKMAVTLTFQRRFEEAKMECKLAGLCKKAPLCRTGPEHFISNSDLDDAIKTIYSIIDNREAREVLAKKKAQEAKADQIKHQSEQSGHSEESTMSSSSNPLSAPLSSSPSSSSSSSSMKTKSKPKRRNEYKQQTNVEHSPYASLNVQSSSSSLSTSLSSTTPSRPKCVVAQCGSHPGDCAKEGKIFQPESYVLYECSNGCSHSFHHPSCWRRQTRRILVGDQKFTHNDSCIMNGCRGTIHAIEVYEFDNEVSIPSSSSTSPHDSPYRHVRDILRRAYGFGVTHREQARDIVQTSESSTTTSTTSSDTPSTNDDDGVENTTSSSSSSALSMIISRSTTQSFIDLSEPKLTKSQRKKLQKEQEALQDSRSARRQDKQLEYERQQQDEVKAKTQPVREIDEIETLLKTQLVVPLIKEGSEKQPQQDAENDDQQNHSHIHTDIVKDDASKKKDKKDKKKKKKKDEKKTISLDEFKLKAEVEQAQAQTQVRVQAKKTKLDSMVPGVPSTPATSMMNKESWPMNQIEGVPNSNKFVFQHHPFIPSIQQEGLSSSSIYSSIPKFNDENMQETSPVIRITNTSLPTFSLPIAIATPIVSILNPSAPEWHPSFISSPPTSTHTT